MRERSTASGVAAAITALLFVATAVGAPAVDGGDAPAAAKGEKETVAIARPAPDFPTRDRSGWINSPPLTMAGLRGRVVVLNIWTFG